MFEMTRRSSLVTAAGSVAQAAMALPSAREFRGKVAIMGLGPAGMNHLPVVSGIEGLEVVAVADPLPERVQLALSMCRAKERRPPAAFDSGEAVMRGCRADVVVIATPDGDHEAHLTAALADSCHVVAEPLPAASVS